MTYEVWRKPWRRVYFPGLKPLGFTPSSIIKATRPIKLVRSGIIGGQLDFGRLRWRAVVLVMLVIQSPAGDRRNWSAIRSWAAELPRSRHRRGQVRKA